MYSLDPNNIILTKDDIMIKSEFEIIREVDNSDFRNFIPKLVPIYDNDGFIKDYGKIKSANHRNDDFILHYIFGDPFGFYVNLNFLVENISKWTDPEKFQNFIISELNEKNDHYERTNKNV